jgi:hypothetical protein
MGFFIALWMLSIGGKYEEGNDIFDVFDFGEWNGLF